MGFGALLDSDEIFVGAQAMTDHMLTALDAQLRAKRERAASGKQRPASVDPLLRPPSVHAA